MIRYKSFPNLKNNIFWLLSAGMCWSIGTTLYHRGYEDGSAKQSDLDAQVVASAQSTGFGMAAKLTQEDIDELNAYRRADHVRRK